MSKWWVMMEEFIWDEIIKTVFRPINIPNQPLTDACTSTLMLHYFWLFHKPKATFRRLAQARFFLSIKIWYLNGFRAFFIHILHNRKHPDVQFNELSHLCRCLQLFLSFVLIMCHSAVFSQLVLCSLAGTPAVTWLNILALIGSESFFLHRTKSPTRSDRLLGQEGY